MSEVKEIIRLLDKAVVSNILTYDMRQITPFYDYCIICSVSSSRQGNAAVTYLTKEGPTLGFNVRSVHSNPETKWFLVDLGSIIVHIFVGDERKEYNLDGMYGLQNLLK